MAEPPMIVTRSLFLRAPEPADVDPLFAIQGDPVAMRHTFCAPDRAATAEWLRSYADRFAIDGFAPWTAVLRHPRQVVGWGGLNRDPHAPGWGVEVTYFIDPSWWGRGLATELVGAALALAFDRLALPDVNAFVRPANRASARVLQKTGFTRLGHVPELERDHFRIAPGKED
jgi:ribosomal-protein-alanine N-acetyltransferase